LGNYEESTENDEETPEDNKNTEGSQNDSRTPTRPETEITLSTSDEIPTVTTLVTTSISDATPSEDD